MRKTLCALGLAVAVSVTASVPAAAGLPQRPAGPVVPALPSDNGGDNGWGNCGHNSSGGHPPVKTSEHRGNGGYKKGDGCAAVVSDPEQPGEDDPIHVS